MNYKYICPFQLFAKLKRQLNASISAASKRVRGTKTKKIFYFCLLSFFRFYFLLSFFFFFLFFLLSFQLEGLSVMDAGSRKGMII